MKSFLYFVLINKAMVAIYLVYSSYHYLRLAY